MHELYLKELNGMVGVYLDVALCTSVFNRFWHQDKISLTCQKKCAGIKKLFFSPTFWCKVGRY